MAWYYWLWIIIAIPFFLWGYNILTEEARSKGQYLFKPTRAGHLAMIYGMDPIISILFAALWPIWVIILGCRTIFFYLRPSKKVASDD